MFVLNSYFCRESRFVAILRSKLRFLLRNAGVDSDFTQNIWGKNWRLGALVVSMHLQNVKNLHYRWMQEVKAWNPQQFTRAGLIRGQGGLFYVLNTGFSIAFYLCESSFQFKSWDEYRMKMYFLSSESNSVVRSAPVGSLGEKYLQKKQIHFFFFFFSRMCLFRYF